MQSRIDFVKNVMAQQERGDMLGASVHFSDDFVFSGLLPWTLNKSDYLALIEDLVAAMPDWKFNITGAREAGEVVKMKVRITGINTRVLNIPMLGILWVSPTGRRVALPEEAVEVSFEDEKISGLRADPEPHGGVMGILEQLGVKVPASVHA